MARPDPFQARARELAIAAGLDPDARIERPGQRSMPTWCTFRHAAIAGEKAREVAEAPAAGVAAIAPQAAEFQNRPLKVFGKHDDATIAQMRNCMGVGNVAAGVICADGHLGYAQPVGGVIAYEKQISISGVGFDIGCGNMAVRLDTPFAAIEDKVGAIIKDVARVISFGIGRSNEERVEHDLFDDADAWRESDMEAYRQKAVAQLGTSGRATTMWISCAMRRAWSGSACISAAVASATPARRATSRRRGARTACTYCRRSSTRTASSAAATSRRCSSPAATPMRAASGWSSVRKIIGGAATDKVHNHHNYAWRETHNGRDLWVVRKGATPAFPGQRGFVGGSMGDDAVIIEGVDGAEARASLYSTVHGAGRLFDRMEAKRRFSRAEMDA
jgi:tRNA-splicing ligase RtcB (3'-phosphate/5'-hydroxy nucleic acid ligase)